ncbi:YfhO family protein [Kurthia sp. Dielmo]|uniref:YfhO family protein n=1 Tax=Kurthia sp. Dielmo TaxID=1033738 RepID=UPI001121D254|nr:YfhO family protein [Kurthia sp. Dielmo]
MKKYYLLTFVGALLLSIIGHGFYLWKWTQGYLMVGFGDGLSQMLFFKQFILEHYQQGNWAYAENFGFGGGIFSQLNYYFSTNIFLIPWYIIFSILPIKTSVETWALLLIPMSIIKQIAIFYACFYFLNYFTKTHAAAFLGAVVYMFSPFFFKNQVLTDNLTDVLFWVPLLLIGVERIIRHQSPIFFIISTALLLISNFYISYVVLIITGIYILLRLFLHITNNERQKKQQIKWYILGSLLSFGISCFSFIPAVISYLHNNRPAYEQSIPFYALNTELLLSESKTLWLPIFIVIFLLLRPLYQHRAFKLFAFISILGTVLYFSPFIGSLFNGFSAPNTRWTPIITLGYAGLTAITIENLNILHKKQWFYATITVTVIFLLTILLTNTHLNFLSIVALIWALISIGLFLTKKRTFLISSLIIIMVLVYSNFFQSNLYSHTELSTKEYLTSDKYMPTQDTSAFDYIKNHELNDTVRTDWSNVFRENMTSLMPINGFSLYSSISNGPIMDMYMRDLQIDTGRESLSRYRSLGDRTNLMAAFQSQFYMRHSTYKNIPYLYENVHTSKNFTLYENQKLLPAFRVVDSFYNEEALQLESTLAKEHALLQGAITDDGTTPLPTTNTIRPTSITLHNGKWKKDRLIVPRKKNEGEILIQLPKIEKIETLYVQMTLSPIKRYKKFTLKINDYETSRRSNYAKYKTGFNDLTFAIPASDLVKIKLPSGKYHLTNLRIYGEDYKTLDAAYKAAKKADFTWDNADASGTVTAKKDDLLVTPIPYEPGWHITLNNEKVDAKKINYAFIGIPLQQGQNQITMHYAPPYWSIVWPISVVSLILLVALILWRKKSSAN